MDGQREAAEQVSVIKDIPDNSTEGQVHGGEEESTEGWSWSPMQRVKVQPSGYAWSWSPFQAGMSTHHLQSGWSWSPITNVQHKYYGRWSWSPSQLKILPYATQEQSDVQGQPSLTDVNCWPVFIDTYRSKRKRTRKRGRSKKGGPYNYKRERSWKTLTCVTGPTQGTEQKSLLSTEEIINRSQASENTKQWNSYSCVSETTLSTSQTQRGSNIWSQREINSPCLRNTGIDGVRARSASPAPESKAERNIKSSFQNSNEMSSKNSLPVLETSKMKEYPGKWQKSVTETQKENEEQTLLSMYQVDDEVKLINNPLVYERGKSEGIQNKMNTSVSKMDEKSGTLWKNSLPLSEEDKMSEVDTTSSSVCDADQTEKLQASSSEIDKVNNLLGTLSSQSKFVAADVSTVQVNESSLPRDPVEMIEMHNKSLYHKVTPALDEALQTNNQTSEFEVRKILEMDKKSQAHESEMGGFEKTRSSLPEMGKGNVPQPQNLSPAYETDEKNSSIIDGNNFFTTRRDIINNKKKELLFLDDGAAGEENHSLSLAPTMNTSRQMCKSRSPSPVDKLISGGLKYSLSFELLDAPGGMAIGNDSPRICKEVQSSTTDLSDDFSPQDSTLMSPNEKNTNQVYSNDSYPGSFSSVVNCVNLKHRTSLLYEKNSSTAFSGCPSLKQDSIVDGALENISMKSCQAKELADAMIHCENESSLSLIQESKCLENSIDNKKNENEKKQNILSVSKKASEPQSTLTRTRTLTLPYTETEKFSSVSISGTKSVTPVYERFEYRKIEDCKSLVEELELISKKSSSSSASNEKKISVLQKDLPLPSRSIDICHVKSHHGVLANKDSCSYLEADTSETTSLLQKNMASTLDSDMVIAETERLSLTPQNEVKCSAMEFMSTEPKSPSTTKGLSTRGSKKLSPTKKPSPCKSRSPSPAEGSISCGSRSSFPAEGCSPRQSKSPSLTKGVSPKGSRNSCPAEGASLQGTKKSFLAEILSVAVPSSSLTEGSSLCESENSSSVKTSSLRGSRSPSPIEGSSPWRSRSPFAEGSLLWKSRSSSLAKALSPRRSKSPSPAKVISPRGSRSPFLAERLSLQGSRSPSPAEGLSLWGFRNPFHGKGLSPQESKSSSTVKGFSLSSGEGPTPHGSKSPSPTKESSPRESRSPSPAKESSPRESRSPSPAKESSPRESRSPFPAKESSPRESKSPFPAKDSSPRESRSPSPAKESSPRESRSPSPAKESSPKESRSPSPAKESLPRESRSPTLAKEYSSRESRSLSPAKESSPRESRSPTSAKESSPRESRSPSPAKESSPRESRSPTPAKESSPRKSRSPIPAKESSPRESRSPTPAKESSPRKSRSPIPAKESSPRESRSPTPAKESSPRESRSPSPAKESLPRESQSPFPAKKSSPREFRSPFPAKESSPRESRSPSPAKESSPIESGGPSLATESSPMEPRSPSPVEGFSPRESRSPSSAEGLSPWGSRNPSLAEVLSPLGSKSPLPAKGVSDGVSRSSSPVEGLTLRGSENPSPGKGSSLRESKSLSLFKGFSHKRYMSTTPAEGPSPQGSRSSSPAGRLSLRVSRSLSPTDGHKPHESKSPSPVEEFSARGSLDEEPSPRRSRSPSPNKGLSLTVSRSLSPTEGPSLIGPGNSYLPDFKSLQLVGDRAVTLHSKVEASDVWHNISSCRYFHPNEKTQAPPPLSETVNIQVHIACHSKPCSGAAGGFQKLITTAAPSGVKRKHSACSAEEATIYNSQQRKKIASDPTETLNAILRKIHGGSIPESSTSHTTVCRKSVVTRAVTRRLAHRSPNHDLHHVASARMEIFEAVESGDFEKVRELMQDTGPAVRRKDTHCTLLHEAVNHRQVDMVLFFLKYINPNVVSREGSTPAHLAARKGHTQILRLLLADPEMDPNKRDHFNNTYKNWLTLPLLEAVLGDSRARVQELLRLGADPDHSAEHPEDGFADKNMKITTARQLAHTLQRDNLLPLFKRKSAEDDPKSVEDDEVGMALPGLLFPKKNNGMDNEITQLEDTSLAIARGPDVYRMDAAPRGYVCILSYGSFHDRPDLHLEGSQTDAHNLANTFSKMGYRGHAHFSLTAGQTRQQLAKVRDMELLERAGCAVFIISSHGEPRRHFLTSDMQTIDIQWVLDFFKDSQCPYLKNKPKLFIWDLCRGHQEQECGRGKTHGELCGRVDEPLRDVMCLDSSSGGFTWHAFSEEGTPFIGALCSVLARHAATKELSELYREFLKEYATAAPDAVPQLTNYGFNKKFYFN